MSKLDKTTLLDKIKSASRPESVHIDGIDEPLFIRRISVAEQAKLAKLSDDQTAAAVALVLYGVGDETGNRLFDDKDASQIEELDSKTVGHIVEAISRVNFGKDAKTAEKNS